MKKLIYIFSVVLFLSSCGDDDNGGDTPGGTSDLVGRWEYVKLNPLVETGDKTTTEAITAFLKADKERQSAVEFTKDGKFGEYDPIGKKWYWGKYRETNGKIELAFDDTGDWVWEVADFRIEGKTLIQSIDETSSYKVWYPDANVTKAIQRIERQK